MNTVSKRVFAGLSVLAILGFAGGAAKAADITIGTNVNLITNISSGSTITTVAGVNDVAVLGINSIQAVGDSNVTIGPGTYGNDYTSIVNLSGSVTLINLAPGHVTALANIGGVLSGGVPPGGSYTATFHNGH